MTENATEQPRPDAGAPSGGGPPPGWHSEHLTDYRALRRATSDRKVAGVAGGLGVHLNIDPTILRVLFVVLAFFGGSGVLLYAALWLLVPEEGTDRAVAPMSASMRNGMLIAAAVLAGLLALGETWTDFWLGWPLAVVGVVVAVVLLNRDRKGTTTTAAPPPYAGAAPAPPPYGTPTAPYAAAPVQPSPPPAPRRTGPLLFGITLALLAIALGTLGLYQASGGDVPDAAYPALALGVVGVMLVVGAFWGRPGGLIALGLLAVLLLVGFSIGRPSFDGDRVRTFVPQRAVEVADAYQVPAGRIELDLTELEDVEQLDGRLIRLEANAGELVVIVPDGLAVEYDADIAFGGAIETPAGVEDGWSRSAQGRVGDEGAPTVVELDLDLGFGHIAVVEQ